VVGAAELGAAVVGAKVVGSTVVGAAVVGAVVVGAVVVGTVVVGAAVVGATVVGAKVVGATVVGAEGHTEGMFVLDPTQLPSSSHGAPQALMDTMTSSSGQPIPGMEKVGFFAQNASVMPSVKQAILICKLN